MRFPFRRAELPPKIERLRLEPGDVLVIKTARRLTQEQVDQVRGQLQPVFIDHEILVISDEISLSVVHSSQAKVVTA